HPFRTLLCELDVRLDHAERPGFLSRALAVSLYRRDESGIELAHIGSHQRHRYHASVAFGEDSPEHRLEVVNVAVDRALELDVEIILCADLAVLAAAEETHGASGKHCAIALQVRIPSLVVDFVGEDLADVDRRRVHGIDE